MSRILLLVSQKENRRLLADTLSRRHEVVIGEDVESLREKFDLAILDGVTLDRLSPKLNQRKIFEEPYFLPILLITSRQDIGLSTRHLWHSVDELITTPIEKLELQARVEVLLRARRCSLELGQSNEFLKQEVATRQETEANMRFLANAGAVLGASLDYHDLAHNLAELVAPRYADCAAVDIFDDHGRLHRIAVICGDPASEQQLRDLHDDDLTDKLFNKPVLVSDIALDTSSSAYMKAAQLIHARSFMILPLMLRDRSYGTLFMAQYAPRAPYNENDLALANELASRAAQSIENAKLYSNMQDALASRDEFLSVAAHELRTPITGILGFAQLLMTRTEKLGDSVPPSFRQGMRRIQEQSNKLSALISQLLDMSRIEAGRLSVERQRIDLVNVVRGVAGLAQDNASSNHTLTLTCPDSVMILGDALRLEQVFANLIDNAIKYSPAGGLVRVEIAEINPHAVQVSVRDQGIGIEPQFRAQIFERFYQAHSGHHVGGLGLGLYICREIVELHSGTITVSFPPEGGTCFTVELPLDGI